MANGDDRDEIPWYRQPQGPEPYLTQAEEPPQAPPGGTIGGRNADEVALQNYLSPPREASSLLGALGGGAQTPAGGSALMLPLLMAQMQQSPLNAFSNAYAAADARLYGRPAPAPTGPSQYQQFEMVHALIKDQALEKERAARAQIAQGIQARLNAKDADARLRADETLARRDADFAILQGGKMMGSQDPIVRQIGTTAYLSGLTKRGIQVDPNEAAVFDAFANGGLSHKDASELIKDAAIGIPDPILLVRRGVTPEILAGLRVKGGPVEQLMGANQVKFATDVATLQEKEYKVLQERFPELKGDGAKYFVQAMREEGKKLTDATDEDAARYNRRAVVLQNNDVLNLEAAKSKITQGREINVAQARSGFELAKAQALKQFEWANTPANMTGHTYMNRDGQTASVEEMQNPERSLGAKGFFRAQPAEMKQVNTVQMMRAMWDDTVAAGERADKLGAFATRQGALAQIPIIGPLAETAATKLGVQRATTRDPDMLTALSVLETKKAAMVGFARANGDNLRALAAVQPEMDAIDPSRGYPAFQKVMKDIDHSMRAQVGMSRTPGAWDAQPTAMPDPKARLSAEAQQRYDNGAARLRASMPPGKDLNDALDTLRRKLMGGF